MENRAFWIRRPWSLCVVAGLAGGAGCIDGFKGSNVQIDFAPATPVQVTPGATPGLDQLPNNIHFTLYAIQYTKDDSGAVTGNSLFALQQFEIHPVIDLASPCFIDVGDHVPFPGLHVSQYATVIGQQTGIPDVSNPPPDATDANKILAATADQREANVQALAGPMGIRAITSISTFNYTPAVAGCVGDAGVDATMIPAPTCTDPASNAQRLTLCQAAWAANPGFFEGTDRVLSEPLSGTEFGTVDGINPVNLAPVGGSEWFMPDELAGFDAYAVYWQYDDANGDGLPDYPASVPADQRSATGQLLVVGTPTMLTRGVDHVHMINSLSTMITADMAIFANLDNDSTTF